MVSGTLVIILKDGAAYRWPRCTNIRQSARELRWTNARGEKRSLAAAFIATFAATEEHDTAATFHLTDGTTVTGVTTYVKVGARHVVERVGLGPIYSVFTADDHGHRYIAVDAVARIESGPPPRLRSWYDLPIAAGMWAADGADLGA